MNRKKYGRRFPLKPIERNDATFYEEDEPVAEVVGWFLRGPSYYTSTTSGSCTTSLAEARALRTQIMGVT